MLVCELKRNRNNMPEESRRKFELITIVYWILLTYIIAALVWWFFSLYTQNEMMYNLRKQELQTTTIRWTENFQKQLLQIDEERKRNIAKYIGEGGTFLILILVGAAYVYRLMRRQFRIQQQQHNFVMAITHELKTPISVSRLNLETLQRYKLDEEKKEKLVNMTLQETLRLDNLINNILISSQLDGHSYRISKEELSFTDLVNDVANHFTMRYHDRKLIKNIEDDVDIEGDPLLLKLLVSNLLENANKYSPKDKPITLELKASAEAIQLSVKDEGCGIKNEEKKNVFKKFYRIGDERTRTTKGTGLGLHLCKKIAEDHEASITVEDNHPQGSNFIVSFYT
jgi:two-component system, OmpR family, sensor histidine kinase CiaH